jgi:hypothetical protein
MDRSGSSLTGMRLIFIPTRVATVGDKMGTTSALRDSGVFQNEVLEKEARLETMEPTQPPIPSLVCAHTE